MIQLRKYQHDLACDVLSSFENVARTVLLVLPTGSGKSILASYIASHEEGYIWVVAHRKELLTQLSDALKLAKIKHGMVKAGLPFDPKQRVQVASIQTLAKRHQLLPTPSLIIYDESHHLPSRVAKATVQSYPNTRVLGLSATPLRLNGQGLDEVFDHMIVGPTVRWLTDNGFLSPAEYYAPPTVADTTSLHIRAGDYAKEESEAVMDKPTVTGDAVEHYRRICDGVPMLVFCTSVAHAKHVADQYSAEGYRASSVDGSMSDEDRKDRIQGLASGKYQIITSCELIGEGLDVPVVGAVQMLRPTASLGLFLQMVGRGLRIHDLKKVTYVLDHVNNVRRHGFATTVHEWSLEGRTKRAKKASEPALRTCGSCFLAHEPAPVCPLCGFIYPKKTLARIETVDGKLVKLEETKEERAAVMRAARSMPELIAFAKARGYSKPTWWARKVYQGRNYLNNLP